MCCAPAAPRCASVNTVVRLPDGRLEGHSTDGDGFVASLREAAVDPQGRSVVVLGAGAAARSVIDALARAGAGSMVVVNRSSDRAAGRRAARPVPAGRVGHGRRRRRRRHRRERHVGRAWAGTAGGRLPVPAALLRAGQVVADLVYHPLDTPLLRAARAAGAVTVDGLGMLVHQAALQQLLWLGGCPTPR